MRGQEINIKAKDDVHIRTITYNIEGDPVNGIVIVCHGFGEHSGSYAEFANRLAQENYATIVFDQRGHGKLSEPTWKKRKLLLGVIPSYQRFLDDIGSVVAKMRIEHPDTPIILYGHSMGGNIAANYLLKYNQSDFSCALLEAPWFGLYKEVDMLTSRLTKVSSYVLPHIPLPQKLTKLPLHKITSYKPKQEEIGNDPLYHNRMTLRMFSGIHDGCTYAINSASQLSIPVYLALAKYEMIVSNQAILNFYDACRHNAEMQEYESCHSIHNDVQREKFYCDIITFFNVYCHAVQPA